MPTTARTPRRRSAAGVALLSVAAIALSGCSASSGSASSGSLVSEGYVADRAAGAGTSGDGVQAPAADPAKEGTAGGPLAVVSDRSIVVVSDVALRVDDIRRATTELATIAARHRATVASQTTSTGPGGAVAPRSEDGSCPSSGCPTPYASSTTTLRLDNDDVDDLLRAVGALGTVLSSTLTSDDVTAEVADVDARLRNAEASLARVRALMGRATTIGDIVALEAELSRRQGDLEALQARQRTLADQSAQATVTITLVDEGSPAAAKDSTGFVAGLRAGWDAFTGAMVVALTVLGALLPFLLLVVPLALLVWFAARRRRTGVASVPTDAVTANAS